jgi:8-oxo-dGTP diphosphatase
LTAADKAPEPIHVVAAAVTNAEGRVLIAQRPPGKVLAGSWEFPGGKVEAGETRVQALARELSEELGITLTGQPRPLMRLRHSYPFGDVLIDMWVVTRYRGEPVGLDGQALRWCTLEELETAEMLPADRPIVAALRLNLSLHGQGDKLG